MATNGRTEMPPLPQQMPPVSGWDGDQDEGGLGTTPPAGEYTEYMVHVRLLADPVMSEVSEGLKYIVATKQEKNFIMRLMPLAELQLRGESGWWEVELDYAMGRRRLLRDAIADWDGQSPVDQDRLPLSKREASHELAETETRIRDLRLRITTYKARGHYWSVKPLLEYMDRPQEERQGYAYDHLLPPLMQDLKQAILASMPPGIGWANRQAIGSNQMMDLWQESNLVRAGEGDRRPMRRRQRPKVNATL